MQYLLTDPQAQSVADLGLRDDDNVGLVSLSIHGFIGDADRDVEREECVRLLVAQGADMAADKEVMAADKVATVADKAGMVVARTADKAVMVVARAVDKEAMVEVTAIVLSVSDNY